MKASRRHLEFRAHCPLVLPSINTMTYLWKGVLRRELRKSTSNTRRATLGVILLLCGSPALHGEESEPKPHPTEASYYQDVRPILQRRCQACHQPASKQGDLLLTDHQGFRQGGKSGPAFVPGEPEESIIIAHLTGKRGPRMPLGLSPLTDSEIELFRLWIRSGAQDDTPLEV